MGVRETSKPVPCAVALGDFDGIHLGHRQVLNNAAATGLPTVAFIIHCPFTILAKKDMAMLLKQMDITPEFADFSRIAGMDGETFVKEVLIGELNAAAVCCGYNFRFGKGAGWDAPDLKKLCSTYGIGFYLTPEVAAHDGGVISSTRIRQAISAGDMALAEQLTGRPYSYRIVVEQGDRRGRTIGFPTINQKLNGSLVTPRFGVYASQTLVDGIWYQSITNIGLRPTYRLEVPQSETHIIGYAGDLYGCEIVVALKKHLRDEKRFPSLEALKAQIAEDIRQAQDVDTTL